MNEIKPQFEKKDLMRVFDKNKAFSQSDFLHHEILDRLIDRLSLIKIQPEKIVVVDHGLSAEKINTIFPSAKIEIISDLTTSFLYENNSVDMVFSNLFFHWSPDPESLFKEISRILKPNGLLMFSMLGPDSLKELRFAWGAADKYPHVHDFYDLHDVGDSLMRSHFLEPVMDMEQLTIEYKSTDALFSDLKNTNAVNILSERRKTLTGKKRFGKFLTAFETFKQDGKYPLSFEMVYGHAWGGVERLQGEVEVPVSVLKRS